MGKEENTQVGKSRGTVRNKNAGAKFHLRKCSVLSTQSFLQIRKLSPEC